MHVKAEHAVAVNGGTSALHLIVRAMGIGTGDKVITTLSFVVSTNCIPMEGTTPVFADIDLQALCLNPRLVGAAMTPGTKAILSVDVVEHSGDWPAPMNLSAKHSRCTCSHSYATTACERSRVNFR